MSENQTPGEPPASTPTVSASTTDQPATNEPATDQPATNKPATDQPATNKPATNEPGTAGADRGPAATARLAGDESAPSRRSGWLRSRGALVGAGLGLALITGLGGFALGQAAGHDRDGGRERAGRGHFGPRHPAKFDDRRDAPGPPGQPPSSQPPGAQPGDDEPTSP
ncbi:MAG: hypothetical protein ACRCYU_11550 [Nocardioides sp.]